MKVRMLLIALATLFLAACATGPTGGGGGYGPAYGQGGSYARCNSCGVVEDIREVRGEGGSSGAGAVLGGLVGGVLGNQVGGGRGRTAATAAGAVGGAVAGNRIEQGQNLAPTYDIFIQMDDGRRLVVNQRDLAGIRVGSSVEITGTGNARLR